MTVQVTNLNLDIYNPFEIIQMHKDGLITLAEIRRTGVAHRCFTNILAEYIGEKLEEESGKTYAIIHKNSIFG